MKALGYEKHDRFQKMRAAQWGWSAARLDGCPHGEAGEEEYKIKFSERGMG